MKNPGLYILINTVNGMQYVGKDSNLPSRSKEHLSGKTPQCPRIHNAIKKYGADTFCAEIIQYPGISQEALNAVERWWIRRLQTLSPSGYNLTEGGDGAPHCEETRRKLSESKKAENNPMYGKPFSLEHRRKLSEALKGQNNPMYGKPPPNKGVPRTEETLQKISESVSKQVADGTHNFLGKNNPVHKQVADGTHNFLGEKHPMKRLAKEGRHPQTRKRRKAEWCYIIAVSRFYYEIHDYTLKRRAEFLSKDIPDTSNAEQINLF